ncbi:MSC_0621 family F1-like ATPase epsilon subunit [Metamycoplasma canadense]|uniref:Uncharacterized protein n=1 Tax=Metamycoplasma canadense TaxID=29554 RepID=A0A077LCG9_9BACT|nr:hypothetical protein [Metamycoplasma canadense]BAP39779.1 hypothetical protein MCAN360_0755 [Metamycoplasma canadense]
MSTNANQTFKIQINFLDNKTKIIRNGLLFINVDDEDQWVLADSNAIMAYENTVIKIKDLDEEKEFYLFLINTNIIINQKNININTFNKMEIFKQNNKTVDNKNKIREVLNNISYFNSLQKIGLNLDQFMQLKLLNQELYLLKIQQNLKLAKEIKYENKK